MTTTGEIRLLLVGPSGGEIAAAARLARDEGAEVTVVDGVAAALAVLRTEPVGLVMIDVAEDVAGFLARLGAERFAVPVLACGIDAPAERAVAAIRAGARDYVPLPPDRDLIAAALAAAAAPPVGEPVGADPAWVAALAFARALAPGHRPLLLVGEAGTGKRLVARAIHAASRRTGMFLTVECAGVAPEIVEAELFGRAAGALPPRAGKLAQAAGGTLFLRDVDRLAPVSQALLAEAIADPRRGTARLVVSTTEDLVGLSQAGRFRADLVQHIAAARVALPSLAARGQDVALLAHHLLARIAAAEGVRPPPLDDAALAALAGYGWPGNARELEDVLARALVVARGAAITPADLILATGAPLVAAPTAARGEDVDGLVGRTVEDVERALILKTLEHCHGNRTSASGILGISVRTMRNKLKAFLDAGIPVMPAA